MSYAYVGNPRAVTGRRQYVDTSAFRSPFSSPTLTLTGLGAAALGATSVTTQECNAFKNCANPKLVAAGFLPVPQGGLGPLTCAAAYNSAGNGCAYQQQIKTACSEQKLTGATLPRAIKDIPESDPAGMSANVARTLEIATIMAQQTAKQMEQKNMTTTAYPWNTYSANTLALQKRANVAAYEAWKAGDYVGCYCKIAEDGKLGSGSCGAIRNVGLPTPPSCQSFATGCKGEMICASGATPAAPVNAPTAAKPPTTSYTPPTSTTVHDPVQVFTPSTKPAFQMTTANVIVGGVLAAAIGVGGYAVYTVGKKKGWFK